jgi:Leucine-rich repeat (LRR) protein
VAVNLLKRELRTRAAVAQIKAAGGSVGYSYLTNAGGIPRSRRLINYWFGEDAFATPVNVVFQINSTLRPEEHAVLNDLPSLYFVCIGGDNATDETLAHVCRLPNLENVRLFNPTRVTHDGIQQLANVRHLSGLTLEGPGISDDAVEPLKNLNKLESLVVIESKVTSAGLQPLSNLHQLRHLTLARLPGFDDDGIRHLAELRELETLSLDETAISDKSLAVVGGLHKLTYLSLARCDVSAEGLRSLQGLQQLECIDLSETTMDDGACEVVVNFSRLQTLRLNNTRISDAGLKHLAKMQQLGLLDLSGTAITDDGLQELATLKQLWHLDVGPNVSRGAARKLKQSLPKCGISKYSRNGSGFHE